MAQELTPADTKHTWQEVPRVELSKRSVAERIADFHEVYSGLDTETVRAQASRCLQCPDPPCMDGCPLRNRIPEWLALVAEGQFLEAAELIQSTGCMPEILSKMCRQSCEQFCVLERAGGPVAINAIEQFLNDYAQHHSIATMPPQPPNGLRVAVLGSGPCGLACAYDLLKTGYTVAIFDTCTEPGGVLMRGIPGFKLESQLMAWRIHQLEEMGATFNLRIRYGVDLSLAFLRTNYDAVFIGIDADHARPLEIPGAQLSGIGQALDFLTHDQSVTETPSGHALNVRGKRVLVLGGGDLAIDCLRSAIRWGAREIAGVYRRDQASMPCHPKEFANAVEEGAKFFFNTVALSAHGNLAGEITRLRCARTRLGALDDTDRPTPCIIPGSEFELEADVVLAAYGFVPPPLLSQGDFSEIAANEQDEIVVDSNQMTRLPGVFAAGALVCHRQLLAEAVRDARAAACGIRGYLAVKEP